MINIDRVNSLIPENKNLKNNLCEFEFSLKIDKSGNGSELMASGIETILVDELKDISKEILRVDIEELEEFEGIYVIKTQYRGEIKDE